MLQAGAKLWAKLVWTRSISDLDSKGRGKELRAFIQQNNILCGNHGYPADSFELMNLWFYSLESESQSNYREHKCKF